MKSIIKGTLVLFVVFALFFCVAVRCSWFQKACLWGLLRTHYDTVTFANFQGGPSIISADNIEGKSKRDMLKISQLKLDWAPLQLVFKRNLVIRELQAHIYLESTHKSNFTAEKVQTAGFHISKKHPFKLNSFLDPLKLPIQLNIQHAQLDIQCRIPNLHIQHSHFTLKDITTSHAGVCDYTFSLCTFCEDKQIQIDTQGQLQVNLDTNGAFKKIVTQGKLSAGDEENNTSQVTYEGMASKTANGLQEKLTLGLHCGAANDFTLHGETNSSSDYGLLLRWQGVFDHSLLKCLQIKDLPTLFIFIEGDCGVKKNSFDCVLHNLFSVWAKNFKGDFSYLPSVSLKARLDAQFNDKNFTLNRFQAYCKNKETSQLLFTANTLQTLHYSYKNGLQAPKDATTPLFDFDLKNFPLDFFNTYLQPYKVQGTASHGNLSFSWEPQEHRWVCTMLQPLRVSIDKMTFDQQPLFTNIQGRFSSNLYCKEDFSKIEGTQKMDCFDSSFLPIFAISSNETLAFNNDKPIFDSKGDFFFSYHPQNTWLKLKSLEGFNETIFQGSFDAAQDKFEKQQLHLNATLKSNDHLSDVTCSLEADKADKKDKIKCQITSEQLFVGDLLALTSVGQSLAQEVTSLPSESVTKAPLQANRSQDSHPIQQTGNTVPLQSPCKQEAQCDFIFKNVYLDELLAENLSGKFELKDNQIQLKMLQGSLAHGEICSEASYDLAKHSFQSKGSFDGADIATLIRCAKALDIDLTTYAKINGSLNGSFALTGDTTHLTSIQGTCALEAKQGCIIPAKTEALQAVSGTANLLNLFLEGDSKGLNSTQFFTSYLQSVPFSSITCNLKRDTLDKIDVNAQAINDDIALSGNGFIATQDGIPWDKQKFNCEVAISAPQQSLFASYLSLNKEVTNTLGYAAGPSCRIDGTLGKPNYAAFLNLFLNKPKENKKTKSSPLRGLLDLL